MECPWCGAEPERLLPESTRDGGPKIDWRCGSFRHASEPVQSDGCRINELEKENEVLRRERDVLLEWVLGLRDTDHFYHDELESALAQARKAREGE